MQHHRGLQVPQRCVAQHLRCFRDLLSRFIAAVRAEFRTNLPIQSTLSSTSYCILRCFEKQLLLNLVLMHSKQAIGSVFSQIHQLKTRRIVPTITDLALPIHLNSIQSFLLVQFCNFFNPTYSTSIDHSAHVILLTSLAINSYTGFFMSCLSTCLGIFFYVVCICVMF